MHKYYLTLEGRKLFLEFEFEGHHKVQIPRDCPPEFVQELYDTEIRKLKEHKDEMSKVSHNDGA